MTLIEIQNVVMNNSYVAVVRLDNQTISGKKSVSVPLATLQFLLFQWDTIAQNILDFGFWILDFFGSSSTHCWCNKSERGSLRDALASLLPYKGTVTCYR
ncbi:MAG: hypothetical protein V7L20_24190 [Nostoc sp.]